VLLTNGSGSGTSNLTIYAPMIYFYTAPCVMFSMRADTLCGEGGGGVGAGNLEFCGPLDRAI
jgi:hypothetical protein